MKTTKGKELENKTLEVLEDGTLRIIDNTKYIPQNGEMVYFTLETGIVSNFTFDAISKFHLYLVQHTPVFRTETECKEYKTYLDLLDKYSFDFSIEDWKIKDKSKYYIVYDANDTRNQMYVSSSVCLMHARTHFKTRDYANRFIDEAGESNIKKFMFNIWDE